jgi:thiamine biosynthesis lipoprotein
MARGELALDDVDPAVRIVLAICEELRSLTDGDFEHEPRRGGVDGAQVLDVDAVAKGWIVEDATTALRLAGATFLVNAGGDVTASERHDGIPWRVGIQHPHDPTAIIGTFELRHGAVATSGTYERGAHLRTAEGATLVSVTVVGPELEWADGLSTAVFASGASPPAWWDDVPPAYGLLTMDADDRVRWIPPVLDTGIVWSFP